MLIDLDTTNFHAQTQIATEVLPAQLELALEEFNWSMQRLERALERGELNQEHAFALVSESANALVSVVADYSGDDDVVRLVRRRTAKWFMRSRFHARAHDRPRGYAGDYYTIELLYDPQPNGTGHVGPLLDRWALHLAAAQAVRNRRAILVHKLSTLVSEAHALSTWRITSLGSGPAREIIDLLSRPERRNVWATCIDIDAEALTYARKLAARTGVTDMTFVRENVIKLALGRDVDYLSPQDVIYSVGLFDYLSNKAAVAVLNWMYTHLAPGGTVIVGNVQPGNPTRTYMDTLLDWRLIHRSADQLRQLFTRSQFGEAPVQVECESAGVQLFATATRQALSLRNLTASRCDPQGRGS